MDAFLKQSDKLAKRINEQAVKLYDAFHNLPVEQLNLTDTGRDYFSKKHLRRLFFSLQTSAELLYRSINLVNKSPENLVIMDYGAGMGTLFLLAKMIGIRTVIYNDYNSMAAKSAKSLCSVLKIPMDYFIVGDHRQTYQQLAEKQLSCDIILGRNVVEHIYDLKDFYRQTLAAQPKAVIYFSTTANYHNPANRWYHNGIHKRFETTYLKKRAEITRERQPSATNEDVERLAKATRGLALNDLSKAIDQYFSSGKLPEIPALYTNTANPETGIWAEHVIKLKDYKAIIEPLGYRVNVLPAFWDTHYEKSYKRLLGKTMNTLTLISGSRGGLWFTAFIYVIAEPASEK